MGSKMKRWTPVAMAVLLGLGAQATWAQQTGTVYVSSEKDNKVYVFNGKGDRTAEIAACERPRHMMFSLDKKTLYVCCGNSNELGVIDVATNKLKGRVPLGDSPEIFDFKSDQSVIYVSIEEENVMAAYDMKTSKRLFDVPTAGEPEGIYVTANDKIAYVTSEVGNLVHVIDLSTQKVLKDLKVGKRPRRFTSE
jgi:YVTN family beta-propeller protein